MKGWLTAPQKQYILEHLEHHASLHQEIKDAFCFGMEEVEKKPCIRFQTSAESLDLDRILRIDNLPVLYPIADQPAAWYSFQDGNLIFHHDLLKSAFHLLSGYEEFRNHSSDKFGRFPYMESLPFKLGVTGKPVVNYYFEIILKALDEFAQKNGVPFQRDPVFKKPVLMATHDIDRVNAYSFFETGFRIKQLLGLAENTMSRKKHLGETVESLFHFLNPFSRKDPFWNFTSLMNWEEQRNFRGTYYFLEREGSRNDNSRYCFHYKKFRKLFRELTSRGHEVGIHGTLNSATNQEDMDRTVENLRKESPSPVVGIRQHYLKFSPGKTGRIQENAGLKYDASLGFAEHDGFRHSYCWPFRLYDFQNDCSLKLWEIPLTVMDGTHFYYRKLDLKGSRAEIKKLVEEIEKFNGIFCLLWHNSFFNERELEGITDHYTGILDLCRQKNMEGLTGQTIIQKIEGKKER